MVNNASTAVVVRRTRLALLPHTGIERPWLYLASVQPAVGLRLAATALGAGVRPAGATRALFTGATGGGGGEADSTQSPPPPPPKKKGIVRSILLGSGDEGEFFPEKHSKLAARGKYVHKLLVHNVKPDAWDDYGALVTEHYPRITNDKNLKRELVGSWYTEVGPLDQAVHIWQYNNYPGYHETNELLAKDEIYQRFMRDLRPMLRSRENHMMQEFDFWVGSEPSTRGSIYELRSYVLKPGRLMEWKNEWKKGLEARRKFMEPVGAWFSQLGDLQMVHHMWAFPDLQARKEMREACWEVDGWAQTVYKTGMLPLLSAYAVVR
ncbi:Nipsnap [Cladochytrium tenue]|nr:Nipsnap [Cladochytrium tenue]